MSSAHIGLPSPISSDDWLAKQDRALLRLEIVKEAIRIHENLATKDVTILDTAAAIAEFVEGSK